jgi:AraC family transcriptional regulator
MAVSNILSVSAAAVTAFEARRSPKHPVDIVAEESQWRVPPDGSLPSAVVPRVVATRWRDYEEETREASTVTPDDCHVIGIALRSMNLRLSVSGRTVLDGAAMPGTPLVTGPGASARCVFRGAYDELHLHAPNSLIAECARAMPGPQPAVLCSEAAPTRDPIVERLGWTLLGAEDIGGSVGQLYVDCISIAIVARLLISARRSAPSEGPRVTALPRWRLKRAVDYIEARLDEPISLADLASATGLTRMHFAAQFRAATGLRPHEYLLRRRVERAQEMLLGSGMSVVDIALSVGFQTQSHFTTVFKRFVGQPPLAWRQSQGRPEPVPDQEPWRQCETTSRKIALPCTREPDRSASHTV